MMAVRALREMQPLKYGRDEGSVVACEAFLPMFQLARKVLDRNGLSSSICLLHKRSDEMKVGTDMACPADLLVTEILDSTLLGEGVIPILQHAHDFLLKPNPYVIPHKATLYGQLVECDYLWRLHDLDGVESQMPSRLVLAPLNCKQYFSKQSQYAMDVNPLMDKLQTVSDPFKVFTFEFWTRPDSLGEVEFAVKATRTSVIHAVISWWVLQLDKEQSVFYSTAPRWISGACEYWHDHWKQCVWFLPGQGLCITKDELVALRATHDEISFKYEVNFPKTSVISSSNDSNRLGNLGLVMKPERIGLLGCQKWKSAVMNSLSKALYGRPTSLCLVIDDSLPLTVSTIAISRDSSVFSLLPGLKENASKLVETALQENGLGNCKVKVLGKKVHELNLTDLDGKKVDILLAEPYYQAYENMLPWENLRFWNERTRLTALLNEEVVIIPCKGILFGMAMSMHDLWRSRQSLTTVEGFDHSSANEELGACGNLPAPLEGPILPYSVWQCGDCQELTEPFSIMTFDFTKPIESVNSSTKVQISRSGLCHGIVLWIDWVMQTDSDVVSTGPEGHKPTFWKQGVKLLRSPVKVDRCKMKNESIHSEDLKEACLCVLHLSATFQSQSGGLIVNADFRNF